MLHDRARLVTGRIWTLGMLAHAKRLLNFVTGMDDGTRARLVAGRAAIPRSSGGFFQAAKGRVVRERVAVGLVARGRRGLEKQGEDLRL
jgi:hypothetical protein